MMAPTKSILFLIIISVAVETVGQADPITVRVFDNLTGKPIKNVFIFLNDSISSETNLLGFGEIRAQEGGTLSFTCTDYHTKLIVVPLNKKFQVGMDIEESKLDFKGGIKSFYGHWGSTIKYPRSARERRIQEDIYVEFKVGMDGKSELIKVHHDTKGLFTEEVTRVFKSIPGAWSIEYASRTLLLPIKFRLEDIDQSPQKFSISIVADRELSEIVVTGYKR